MVNYFFARKVRMVWIYFLLTNMVKKKNLNQMTNHLRQKRQCQHETLTIINGNSHK